ncbi:MAG TPA: TfoX/Sxy family DNA transformation protein [Alphaproteobacteria bacterium]|nr:TfoX/Sxy family DNA transformation protein [Alphaproteobacteria bacterium]
MEERPIAALKNLGPTTARDLAEVGVATFAQLREVGPVDAWHRLNELRPKQYSLVGLYALAGALLDKEWKELPPEYRTQLRDEAARTGKKAKRARAAKKVAPQTPSNVAAGN